MNLGWRRVKEVNLSPLAVMQLMQPLQSVQPAVPGAAAARLMVVHPVAGRAALAVWLDWSSPGSLGWAWDR